MTCQRGIWIGRTMQPCGAPGRVVRQTQTRVRRGMVETWERDVIRCGDHG